MDFFESQDRARRSTWLLVFYFIVAVVLMIVSIYAVTVFALGLASEPQGNSPTQQPEQEILWWQPDVLAMVAVGVLSIIGLGSLYKTMQLQGGGSKVAEMLGGRRLHPYTNDLKEKRLLNVVEEMALAAGVPVPPVYVLDREDGINAFAAGFTPHDAVIGVNRGTLEYLNRDELQGVMAHEFSHILNGDMRLNVRLMGILHGILILSIVGYYVLRFAGLSGQGRSSGGKKGGGVIVILIIGLATLIVGYIGLIFGRLIKAAVSRQREYLADASAVQFTRNPDGIAGALKKIGGLSRGSAMKTAEAESASHLFFGNALKWAGGPMSTHPPLAERIRKLDPSFNGEFPTVRRLADDEPEPVAAEIVDKGSPKHAWGALGAGPQVGPFGVAGAAILASVGQTDHEHVQFAHDLLDAIPEEILQAMHDPFAARAGVFALLLDSDEAIRNAQFEIIQQREGEHTRQETEKLAEPLRALGKEFRLPLINIAQSTLCELSPEQYESFSGTVDGLVKADQVIDLFEFVIQRVLLEHLDRHFHHTKPPASRYRSISAVQSEINCLLSALAHLGHHDDQARRGVVQQAMATLDVSGDLLSRKECSLKQISASLDKLRESSFAVKKRFIAAAIATVSADNRITVAEAELLRAIADSIGCPMPPILAGPLQREGEAVVARKA